MSKNKTEKFREFESFTNTLDFNSDTKGKWHEIFGNTNPVVLELACGKGDYTVGLAKMFPEKNFIGIDIKGNRLWKGAGTALKEDLRNVRFLRIQIDFIEKHFEKDEVSEIWITFPDPQPQKLRKRLTSQVFLNRYRNIAKPNCVINLKTDSDLFYESTLETIAEESLEILENITNVYQLQVVPEILEIQTYYEKMWLGMGRTIKFLKFKLFSNSR
ncbi:MAG: tRNA (guanosine(46)-N7)-methyltransferase TrmB [Bacteroidetes bacterium]|nr:tRNA (guanosine(46)-N7)-methyltransferase TrmB [Bacteroidota bacterium]